MDECYSLIVPKQIIGNNANLNNYVIPGRYKTESAAVSNTVINTPYKRSGFTLTVEYLSNSIHIMQTIRAVNSGYMYMRTGFYADSIWSWEMWYQVLTSVNMQSGSVSVNLTAHATTEFSVTFPQEFSVSPNIYIGVITSRPDLRPASLMSRTKSGFTGVVSNNSSAGTVVVFWTAITP